jgi:hypothetical protein
MLEPCRKLTAKESKVWQRIMQSWPDDHWNTADSILLTHYCCAVVAMDEALKSGDVDAIVKRGKLVLDTARTLRITPHARYDPKTTHRAAERGRDNEAAASRLLGGGAWVQ